MFTGIIQVAATTLSTHAMKVMLADGSLRTVSATENQDLFNLVVGGYGLFGVIVEAELDIAEKRVPQDGRFRFELDNGGKVDVRAFGVRADGTTNDTDAFQDAIDSGAGWLELPAGTIVVVFSYYSQVTRIFWEIARIYRNLESSISEAAEFLRR